MDPQREPFRPALGDTRDDLAGVTVSDQANVAEVVAVEQPHDVLDVGAQSHLRCEGVRPVAHPGQRRGVHLVARGAQQGCDAFPAPAAVPGA